jgi:hypothetical protein
MPSPYRLLFQRLGDRLDATLSPADAREIGATDLDRLKRQGLIRALPLDAVTCPVRTCELDCTVVPVRVPERGDGMFRLPCHRGRVRDQVVHERDIAAYECQAERLVGQLCKSNEATPAFDLRVHRGSGVVPVGKLPWADGALLCLGVGIAPHRQEAELVAALRFGVRPVVVMMPPARPLRFHDQARLIDLGVYAFDMDRVVRWDFLEVDRADVTTGMAARRVPADRVAAERLVLHVTRRDASYLGHRLKLTPIEFGFLLALARSPGKTVPHDDAVDVAYSVAGPVKGEERESQVGQVNKLKSNVVRAFKALAQQGILPVETAKSIITARKGTGFCLNETSVRIFE